MLWVQFWRFFRQCWTTPTCGELRRNVSPPKPAPTKCQKRASNGCTRCRGSSTYQEWGEESKEGTKSENNRVPNTLIKDGFPAKEIALPQTGVAGSLVILAGEIEGRAACHFFVFMNCESEVKLEKRLRLWYWVLLTEGMRQSQTIRWGDQGGVSFNW